MYPKLRKGLSVVLFGEAARSAVWLAGLLPSIGMRDGVTLFLLASRAVVSAAEIAGAVRLFEARASAATLVRVVLGASAVLLTLEIGWRLAPSDLDPTFRWWVVAGYWVYALAGQAIVRD